MFEKLEYLDRNSQIFSDIPFRMLMQRRIVKVLLLCSSYDAFMLEEDGRIEELLAEEYAQLNLRFPPEFIHCASPEMAQHVLMQKAADLVIVMSDYFPASYLHFVQLSKKVFPEIPIIGLVNGTAPSDQQFTPDMFDNLFCWSGDVQVLLAAIKLTEDRLNVQADVESAGVQVILVVEDSVAFYSTYLSLIYTSIYDRSKVFKAEELSRYTQNLIMRGRPKILLATDYEQAIDIIRRYSGNMLGVITDRSFPSYGKMQDDAGIQLACEIRRSDAHLPILLQSFDGESSSIALAHGIDFLSKNTPDLHWHLGNFFAEKLAFGDFEFRTSDNGEVMQRAATLSALSDALSTVDAASLLYHAQRNDFSRWLKARAQFQLAQLLEPLGADDFADPELLRSFIINAIAVYRQQLGRSGIAVFGLGTYDTHVLFARSGAGSMGGKARGIAFLESIIGRLRLADRYGKLNVSVPRTLVLCSEYFDRFIADNNLHQCVFATSTAAELYSIFASSALPAELVSAVRAFAQTTSLPVAVRSSSVQEDSLRVPLAGVYHTQMVFADNLTGKTALEESICKAVKSVYASVFTSRNRHTAAQAHITDDEKMAVVLQEMCGDFCGDSFFPAVSGIANSRNYYPAPGESPEDGICHIAVGLGSYLAGGGNGVHFSPSHPQRAFHLSSPQLALAAAQKVMHTVPRHPVGHDAAHTGIASVPVRRMLDEQNLAQLCSVFDVQSGSLTDNPNADGIRIPTFSPLLQYGTYPLAEALRDILRIGEREMGYPVEVEFAMNIPNGATRAHLMLLQMRPAPARFAQGAFSISDEEKKRSLAYSHKALGNGIKSNIQYIVYFEPQSLSANVSDAQTAWLRAFNQQCLTRRETYILIGPGRWGSTDASLGIPVQWQEICAASAIAEMPIAGRCADFSSGSHFFYNIISSGTFYMSLETGGLRDRFCEMLLQSQEPCIGIKLMHGQFNVWADGDAQQAAIW